MKNEEIPEVREEENFRAEVKRLRLQAGMKQADLAQKMVDEGWEDFNQTTISRLEKGPRPITLAEARTLARILKTPVGVMIAPSKEIRMVEEFYNSVKYASDTAAALSEGILNFIFEQRSLEKSLEDLNEIGLERIKEFIPEDLHANHDVNMTRAEKLMKLSVKQIVDNTFEEMYGNAGHFEELPEDDQDS